MRPETWGQGRATRTGDPSGSPARLCVISSVQSLRWGFRFGHDAAMGLKNLPICPLAEIGRESTRVGCKSQPTFETSVSERVYFCSFSDVPRSSVPCPDDGCLVVSAAGGCDRLPSKGEPDPPREDRRQGIRGAMCLHRFSSQGVSSNERRMNSQSVSAGTE